MIVGGGPSGLLAAEQLCGAGYKVDLYDAMPTVGRKFLLAGLGGLNITHAEDCAGFSRRYAQDQKNLQAILDDFTPDDLRTWCKELGIATFVGTSGRVFPEAMKAAPLLRAWLARLKTQGLTVYPKHRWSGWDESGSITLESPTVAFSRPYDVLILALGGGSWKKLGSDGKWLPVLKSKGVSVAPLVSSNCGFLTDWSTHLKENYAGLPLKSVALSFKSTDGRHEKRLGELILTERGVEGSLIYAFSRRLREAIEEMSEATFYLDLCPNHSPEQLINVLKKKPRNKSLSTFLKTRLKQDAAKRALLFERLDKKDWDNTTSLVECLKNLPVTVTATTPIDEAISTAGGVHFEALSTDLMVKSLSGVFCAGEMVNWDAPTGGYLLTACFGMGRRAGLAASKYLADS